MCLQDGIRCWAPLEILAAAHEWEIEASDVDDLDLVPRLTRAIRISLCQSMAEVSALRVRMALDDGNAFCAG